MPRYNIQNPKAEYKVDCVTFQKPRPKSSEVSEEDLGNPTRLDFELRIYNATVGGRLPSLSFYERPNVIWPSASGAGRKFIISFDALF